MGHDRMFEKIYSTMGLFLFFLVQMAKNLSKFSCMYVYFHSTRMVLSVHSQHANIKLLGVHSNITVLYKFVPILQNVYIIIDVQL